MKPWSRPGSVGAWTGEHPGTDGLFQRCPPARRGWWPGVGVSLAVAKPPGGGPPCRPGPSFGAVGRPGPRWPAWSPARGRGRAAACRLLLAPLLGPLVVDGPRL